MAEETELAFVIARITASEAAFNRSPEGQARRRMADLEYKREAANAERNRGVGLTRAEGKELDALVEQYRPAAPPQGPRRWIPRWRLPEAQSPGAAASNPDSEMEELAAPSYEMAARRSAERAELIARRKAAGDPIPGAVKRLLIQSISWKGDFSSGRSLPPRKRRNCNRSGGSIRNRSRQPGIW